MFSHSRRALILPKTGQVLDPAQGQALPLFHLTGRNEPAALEVREVGVNCIVRECLFGADHQTVNLNLAGVSFSPACHG
jgi:hypothetical protein